MQNPKLRSVWLAIACAAIAFATPASAQNLRSWVSSTGNDASSCLRAAPCATFGGALAKTAIAGQISCADPGDYGTLTITQSVSIDCAEGFGNVFGITINIPTGNPNDLQRGVSLKGLTVQGTGAILYGIEIIASGAVYIDRVRVSGGFTQGIIDHRSDSVGRLFVSNSIIENQTIGILVAAPGIMQVVLENVRSSGNTYGLAVGARASVAVRGSVFAGNSIGVEGDTTSQITLEHCTMNNNTTGVVSNFSVRLSNSEVAFNAVGVAGTAASFGNNRFSGNTTDGTLMAVGAASSDLGEK